ncbi:unnamed protein product [Schistosoma mattheei]|uniref:Uncharacterized protein n=1 Tax=Schistosoma mattheei TaxID=31246 RepID=A0A183NFX7_9TREM|nr:unnamed protein product [Schistosoma mattheei]
MNVYRFLWRIALSSFLCRRIESIAQIYIFMITYLCIYQVE